MSSWHYSDINSTVTQRVTGESVTFFVRNDRVNSENDAFNVAAEKRVVEFVENFGAL